MEFDTDWNILSVEEKPQHPKSNYCITGLYFYPSGVTKMAGQVKPSARGELEITTLNEMYLNEQKLKAQILGRGYAWLDAGTMDSILDASAFVQMIEKRQGVKISAVPPRRVAACLAAFASAFSACRSSFLASSSMARADSAKCFCCSSQAANAA